MSRRIRKSSYWQDAPLPREQIVLIPRSLDDAIPADHPVRIVDEVLNSVDWTSWEKKYHGSMGQPPIHPSILCKIWIFALMRRIRSSRQVEYALKHSIDFMWLASGRRVDHGTLCKFRRANSKELKQLFRSLVSMAIDMGVANLSELCIDGTRVLANSNKNKVWTLESIQKVLEKLDLQVSEELQELDRNDDQDESQPQDQTPSGLKVQLQEHLNTLQEMERNRGLLGKKTQGKPAQLPKTDPDSRILPNKEGGYAPNYTPMVATETMNGFIVEAQVEIGNVEHTKLYPIVDQVQDALGVKINRVLVDSAYTTGENLKQADDNRVEIIGPIPGVQCKDNPAIRDDPTVSLSREVAQGLPMNPTSGKFDRSAFIYDSQKDCFHCPAGKVLEYSYTEKKTPSRTKPIRSIYVCKECRDCPLADLCRKNPQSQKGREVIRDIYDPHRDKHRKKMQTQEAKAANARRSHYGETQFAIMKGLIGIRRFLLRGIDGVTQEWLWGATAFNLQKLVGIIRRLRLVGIVPGV
ncbi:MAG: IS1182 family transposase [Planctomycetota bacterium]